MIYITEFQVARVQDQKCMWTLLVTFLSEIMQLSDYLLIMWMDKEWRITNTRGLRIRLKYSIQGLFQIRKYLSTSFIVAQGQFLINRLSYLAEGAQAAAAGRRQLAARLEEGTRRDCQAHHLAHVRGQGLSRAGQILCREHKLLSKSNHSWTLFVKLWYHVLGMFISFIS
jgi:hypothetical protein